MAARAAAIVTAATVAGKTAAHCRNSILAKVAASIRRVEAAFCFSSKRAPCFARGAESVANTGPHLRLATPQDTAGILAIYAPIVRDTPTSFELLPPPKEDMATRVSNTLARLPWLVCTALERLLGYAYAGPHYERAVYQWSVNV